LQKWVKIIKKNLFLTVWQKNNGGTLLKIGKTFRIDVGSNTLLHMHIPKVSSHIQIGTIVAGMYGGLK